MWNWVLTTRQHALIDYIWSAALPMLPRLLGWKSKATMIVDAAAVGGTVQSVLTDYEGGVKGVLPMQGHLANDALIGASLVFAAAVLTEESTEERLGLAALGILAAGAALITEPIPRGRGRQRAKSAAKVWRNMTGDTVGRLAGANPKHRRSNASKGGAAGEAAGRAAGASS